jgi:hypothetical protein
MKLKKVSYILTILLTTLFNVACEVDTKIVIKNTNPPEFNLSGTGELGSLRVTGPVKQREAVGPNMWTFWEIQPTGGYTKGKGVENLGTIHYGRCPEGYVQVYPEAGEAPPLVEGVEYTIDASTVNAKGSSKHFIIQNGKAVEIKNCSEPLNETKS